MDIIIALGQIIIAGIVAYGTATAFLARLDQRVKHLETAGTDNGTQIGSIRERVAACEASLREREPLGKRRSPLSLSDRGVRFLKESGGEKFVDDNFDELSGAVEKLEPKTSYDVQEDAKGAIEALRTDDRLNPLKDYLFKDGSTLEDLFFVMSIHLRDKILKKKGWNVADIDIHK